MRLLVVEDSRRLRQALEEGLRRTGYALDTAANGTEGYEMARSGSYDVVILDLMLPGMTGLEILQKLRRHNNNVHVLILTARDAIEHRVEGLRMGADDYLVKPFAFDELVARIQTLVRRKHGLKNPVVTVGPLEINIASRIARRDGGTLDLTAREFALLEYLALRKGHIVSRVEIEQHIYDGRIEPASNVVDSAICILRKKIDDPDHSAKDSLIQTKRSIGYVLDFVDGQ